MRKKKLQTENCIENGSEVRGIEYKHRQIKHIMLFPKMLTILGFYLSA